MFDLAESPTNFEKVSGILTFSSCDGWKVYIVFGQDDSHSSFLAKRNCPKRSWPSKLRIFIRPNIH